MFSRCVVQYSAAGTNLLPLIWCAACLKRTPPPRYFVSLSSAVMQPLNFLQCSSILSLQKRVTQATLNVDLDNCAQG